MPHDPELDKKLSEIRIELGNKIELVQTAIQHTIRIELDREIERMKLTIGTAWKLLGVTVALIVGAATFFSIKTAYDVDRGIEAAATKEVGKRLGDDSSSAPFRKVLSKALADSYLLRIAAAKSPGRGRFSSGAVELDAASAEQLTNSLKDNGTKEEDFRELVDVLASVPAGDGPSSATRQLVNFVRATSPDYDWAAQEPARRAYVLGRMSHINVADLVTASKVIIKDGSDASLVSAACDYLQWNGGRDVSDVLQPMLSNDNPRVAQECREALARIDPSNAAVQRYLDEATKAPPSAVGLARAVNVAAAILKGPPSLGSSLGEREPDAGADVRKSDAERMVKLALDKGLRFTYDEPFTESDVGRLIAVLQGGTGYGIDATLFLTKSGQAIFSEMLTSAAENNLSAFSQLVGKLTILPWFTSPSEHSGSPGRVHLTMSGNSFLKCSPDINVDSNAAPEGVDVELDAKKQLIAKYSDVVGNAKSGIVVGISDPKAISFEIRFEDAVRRQLEATPAGSAF